MLLPTRCPGCRTPGPVPCRACAARLRPAERGPVPEGTRRCTTLWRYDQVSGSLLVAMKQRRGRALAGPLAEALAAQLDPAEVDVVTWAPTSPARRRRRGHDHAQVLARALARRLRRPCRRLLVRMPGPAQEGRNRAQRLAGPVFLARPVRGRVLVVDDVLTTGATLTAAARALRRAGATQVDVAVAARAPRPA